MHAFMHPLFLSSTHTHRGCQLLLDGIPAEVLIVPLSLGDGDKHDPPKQQTADFIYVRSHDVSLDNETLPGEAVRERVITHCEGSFGNPDLLTPALTSSTQNRLRGAHGQETGY